MLFPFFFIFRYRFIIQHFAFRFNYFSHCSAILILFVDFSILGQQYFQLLSKVLISLLLSVCSWGVTAEQTQCRTTRPVPDHALIGHVVTSLEGKRLESCVISCELTQNCFSINYYTALKKCELNKKTAEWYPSDLLPKSGAVYLNMVVRDYTPCVDRNQPCSGKCFAVTGSLVTRCACELGNAACKNNCKFEIQFALLVFTSLIQTVPIRYQ